MLANVDLTEPMNAVFFMTGVFAWIALVVGGLWFIVAELVFQVTTRLESKRTVELLFGSSNPVPSTPFGYHTPLDWEVAE